jgi:hypothetical protein
MHLRFCTIPEWLRLLPLTLLSRSSGRPRAARLPTVPHCVSDRVDAHAKAGYLKVPITPNPTQDIDGRDWSACGASELLVRLHLV